MKRGHKLFFVFSLVLIFLGLIIYFLFPEPIKINDTTEILLKNLGIFLVAVGVPILVVNIIDILERRK